MAPAYNASVRARKSGGGSKFFTVPVCLHKFFMQVRGLLGYRILTAAKECGQVVSYDKSELYYSTGFRAT